MDPILAAYKVIHLAERLANWYHQEVPPASKPHTWLPTEAVNHYKIVAPEYGPTGSPDASKLPDLTHNIITHGIRQPLQILVNGNKAHLFEGHHRLEVARALGLSHVPVNVYHVGDDDEDWRPHRAKALEPALAAYLRQSITAAYKAMHQAEKLARLAKKPVYLYRGVKLPALDHPAMTEISGLLSRRRRDLGPAILKYLGDTQRAHNPSGYALGIHWTTDPAIAQRYAETYQRGAGPGVMIKALWNGEGEDPNRTDAYDESTPQRNYRLYHRDKERVLLPGTALQVHDVSIQHPRTGQWHGTLSEPVDAIV